MKWILITCHNNHFHQQYFITEDSNLDIVKNEPDELKIRPYSLSSPRWSAPDKTLKQVPIKTCFRGKLNPDLDVSNILGTRVQIRWKLERKRMNSF